MPWSNSTALYSSNRTFSRTLFFYVLKDLVRIFLMASGALAGIMSFGALLRPLTQNGLDGYQVLLLLRYFMPAMSTYSLPVAALFATTVVYGRMSADNEITACRASGMSFLSMTAPAMLLGLFVSLASAYLLCFTVPDATRKGEQVVYLNLAKLIAHQIEETHETGFGDFTIYAQDATLPPENAEHPEDQAVVLRGPLIFTYETPFPTKKYYRVPKSIFSASKATAHIRQNPDCSAALTVDLEDGITFPREFNGAKSTEGGIKTAEFGPVQIPSPMSQKTKFLNIFELKALQADPSGGDQVKSVLDDFIKEDQEQAILARLVSGLAGESAQCSLQSADSTYWITAPGSKQTLKKDTLIITAAAGKPIQFRQFSGGAVRLSATGPVCRISIKSDPDNDQAFATIEISDALIDSGDIATQAPLKPSFVIPLPPEIAAFKNRTSDQYLSGNIRNSKASEALLFAKVDLVNHIVGELYARAAFVVSCVLLVLIGSSLGMMFRSGNFLTAFAVSVIPAMLSTVLIVSGQHMVEGTPIHPATDPNPVPMGIAIIWSGNVIICMTAVTLLARLQRR